MNKVVIFLRFLAGWLFTLFMSTSCCVLMFTVGPRRAWTLCVRNWARVALRIVGIRLVVKGAEHLRGPAVFVCNHASLVDVLIYPALLPAQNKFVAKRELLRIPIWGWAVGRSGAILVDRGNPRAAIKSIREGLRALPRGWSIGVFPEGTRTHDGKLKNFKKGAFHIAIESRLPVVAMGTDGAFDLVPKGAWLVRPGVVYVTVMPPVATLDWTHENVDTKVAQFRSTVQQCMDDAQHRRMSDTHGDALNTPMAVSY